MKISKIGLILRTINSGIKKKIVISSSCLKWASLCFCIAIIAASAITIPSWSQKGLFSILPNISGEVSDPVSEVITDLNSYVNSKNSNVSNSGSGFDTDSGTKTDIDIIPDSGIDSGNNSNTDSGANTDPLVDYTVPDWFEMKNIKADAALIPAKGVYDIGKCSTDPYCMCYEKAEHTYSGCDFNSIYDLKTHECFCPMCKARDALKNQLGVNSEEFQCDADGGGFALQPHNINLDYGYIIFALRKESTAKNDIPTYIYNFKTGEIKLYPSLSYPGYGYNTTDDGRYAAKLLPTEGNHNRYDLYVCDTVGGNYSYIKVNISADEHIWDFGNINGNTFTFQLTTNGVCVSRFLYTQRFGVYNFETGAVTIAEGQMINQFDGYFILKNENGYHIYDTRTGKEANITYPEFLNNQIICNWIDANVPAGRHFIYNLCMYNRNTETDSTEIPIAKTTDCYSYRYNLQHDYAFAYVRGDKYITCYSIGSGQKFYIPLPEAAVSKIRSFSSDTVLTFEMFVSDDLSEINIYYGERNYTN